MCILVFIVSANLIVLLRKRVSIVRIFGFKLKCGFVISKASTFLWNIPHVVNMCLVLFHHIIVNWSLIIVYRCWELNLLLGKLPKHSRDIFGKSKSISNIHLLPDVKYKFTYLVRDEPMVMWSFINYIYSRLHKTTLCKV